VEFDDLSAQELIARIGAVVESKSRMIVANVNAHAMNLAYDQPWLRDFFNRCELVYCDGFGVKWGSAVLGQAISNRASLGDWFDLLAETAAERGYSCFFLGGGERVAEEARRRLAEKHAGLQVLGCQDGYFDKSAASAANQAVIAHINELRPDILVVAMGMPIQERWLLENWDDIDARVAMTSGAVLDYAAGMKMRPPRFLTDHGLEWAGRLFVEPGRLWRRYLVGNPVFVWRVLCERVGLVKFEPPLAR
jgi:N-acetylglucosaminyldiphosphoundecaprenol N-acetyl-beta-D-mannosaminyltransferase